LPVFVPLLFLKSRAVKKCDHAKIQHTHKPVFAFLFGEPFESASLELLSSKWVVILFLITFCLAVFISA